MQIRDNENLVKLLRPVSLHSGNSSGKLRQNSKSDMHTCAQCITLRASAQGALKCTIDQKNQFSKIQETTIRDL